MVRPRLLLSELGRLLITDDLASPRVAPGPNERQISDPRSARCRAVGIATEMLLTKTEQVSDDAGRHFRFRARQRRACKGGPRAANHADLSDCCLSIAEQQLGVVGLPAHALVVHSGSEAPHDRLAGGAGGFVIPLARGLSLRRARLGHGHHILPAGPDRPKRSSVDDPGGIPVVSASLGW